MMSRAPIAALLVAATAVLAACGGSVKGSASAAGQLGHGAEAFPPGMVAFADVDTDSGSAAWKKVETLLQRFPSWPKAQAKMDAELAKTSSDGTSFDTSVKPWLGDEAAIGLYGITIAAGRPVPQWAAFIASKDDGKAAAAVAAGTGVTKTGSYKGYDEYARASGGDRMVAAVGKGAVLVSSDAATLQKSIDAREGGDQLADQDTYKQTLAKLPADSVAVGYVDWQKVAGLLQLAVAAAGSQAGGAAAAASQLGPMLDQLSGVQALGVAAGATDTGFQVHGAVVGTVPTASGHATLLSSLPANSLAALDTVMGSASSSTLNTYLQNPQVQTALAQVKQRTGIDVAADLPVLLSGEIAAYAAPGTPVSGALLLKPADPDAASAALDRIVAGLQKNGMPAPAPLPDGAHGGIITEGSTQISWRRDGDVITIGYGTGGAATIGGLESSPGFQRTVSAGGMQGDQANVVFADLPGILKLAHPSADTQADLGVLGGLLAFGGSEAQTLFLEVPPAA
jgi:hypothetical protein